MAQPRHPARAPSFCLCECGANLAEAWSCGCATFSRWTNGLSFLEPREGHLRARMTHRCSRTAPRPNILVARKQKKVVRLTFFPTSRPTPSVTPPRSVRTYRLCSRSPPVRCRQRLNSTVVPAGRREAMDLAWSWKNSSRDFSVQCTRITSGATWLSARTPTRAREPCDDAGSLGRSADRLGARRGN